MALNYKNTEAEVNRTKYIFLVNKHSLIYTTQKFGLIFLILTKTLNKIVIHVKMQKTTNYLVVSSINTSLTESVLNWSPSCFATAARRFFHC